MSEGTSVGKGVVEIGADVSGLSKDVDAKVKGESGNISKTFADMGKLAGAAFAATAALGVAAFAGLAKIGGSFDEAFDSLRVTTGRTGADLAGLQTSFKNVVQNVPADFGDASKAIGTLTQKLGLTGKPLEDLSGQVLNLSHITGTDLATNVEAAAGLFNSWGTAAADQGGKLDELFRISQATGISVADLATQMTEGGVQFRQAGLSFEQSGALLGTLAKNGLSASDVLPALSKAMATAAKNGEDASTAFKGTFDAIKNAPNDTAAAGIALDMFGAKAGPKFAALIREGKLSYDDLAASIAAGGDTIADATKDTADWSEQLKLLTNKALVILEPLATKAFTAIGSAISWVTPYFQSFAAWLSEKLPLAIAVVQTWVKDRLVPAFQAAGAWIADHWPQILAVVLAVFDGIKAGIAYFVNVIVPKAVAGFKAVFGWLMDNKEVLIGVAAGIGAALIALFVQWAAGAATAAAATLAAAAPFIAIGLAIAAVVAGVIYAYHHFETFRNIVDATVSWVRDVGWPILQQAFQEIVDGVTWVVDWVKAHWEQISEVTSRVFEIIATVVKTYVNIIRAEIEAVIATVQFIWENFGTYIVAYLKTTWDTVVAVVQAAIDVIVGIFNFFKDLFSGNWSKLWGDVMAIVGGVWDGIKALVGGALDNVVTALGVAWTTIKLAVSAAWEIVKSTVSDAVGALVGFVTGIPGRIFSVATSMWDEIKDSFSVVKDFIAGYVDGLVTSVTSIPSRIASAASGMWDGIKNAFRSVLKTIIGWWNDLSFPSFKIPSVDLGPLGSLGGQTIGGWELPNINIPGLAGGGVLTSPSLFVGGEYPGASRNPEIVSPESMLRSIMASELTRASSVGPSAPNKAGVFIDKAEFNNGLDVDDVFRVAQFHMAGV